MNSSSPRARTKTSLLIAQLALVTFAALTTALVLQTAIAKPYRVPTDSLSPTVVAGQRILVDRTAGDSPKRGEMIVFHPPATAAEVPCPGFDGKPAPPLCRHPFGKPARFSLIKRVAGLPGDTVTVLRDKLLINGKQVGKASPGNCQSAQCKGGSLTLGPNQYFVTGNQDNEYELDSRVFGPIQRSWIVGKAYATYWPPRRYGLIKNGD